MASAATPVGPGQAEVHQQEKWTLRENTGPSCAQDLTKLKNGVLEPVSVQNPKPELPFLMPYAQRDEVAGLRCQSVLGGNRNSGELGLWKWRYNLHVGQVHCPINFDTGASPPNAP